jgi:hypothetical protein
MSKATLKKFLTDLSLSREMQRKFKDNPKSVVSEAGLSDDEANLVQSGDLDSLKNYLGDDVAGAQVQVDYD